MTTNRIATRRIAARFRTDRKGAVAVEFAMIVPIMLVLFFGLVEVTSGVATERKVTLTTRTLSDLVSQDETIDDTKLLTTFAVGGYVMQPYDAAPLTATISQIRIGADKVATISWSKSATYVGTGQTVSVSLTSSPYSPGQAVSVADTLKMAPSYPTYLIKSEVHYTYTPAIGYVIKQAIDFDRETYTRPRQSSGCVEYGGAC